MSVHSTQELYDMVGATAQNCAKTYIEGAINGYSQHSINVTTPTSGILAPRQRIRGGGSFEVANPCADNIGELRKTYPNLAPWWADYIGCRHPKDGDADLLLTAFDSEAGVCAEFHAAIAEGGQHIANLPSDYNFYGCDRCYDSMQTALHEVAHALLDYNIDHHKVGRTPTFNGTKYRSPMAGDIRGENNLCGEYVAHSRNECNMMAYSECAEGYLNT